MNLWGQVPSKSCNRTHTLKMTKGILPRASAQVQDPFVIRSQGHGDRFLVPPYFFQIDKGQLTLTIEKSAKPCGIRKGGVRLLASYRQLI